MPIVQQKDGISIRANFTWRGDNFLNGLMPALAQGVEEAANIYRKELVSRYSENVGSVSVGSLQRLRIRHSSPGQAPFAQTFNLALSPRISTNFSSVRGRTHMLKARISTDVPYSHTLEFGGALSVDPKTKKWSRIRLVNPLRSTPHISARPVWRPAFLLRREDMLQAITRRVGVLRG